MLSLRVRTVAKVNRKSGNHEASNPRFDMTVNER